MTAQVRPKTVRITIRIVVWYEQPVKMSNMKSPEEIRDEMVPSHRGRGKAKDYAVKDQIPWKEGSQIIVINITATKIMNWIFPGRDGYMVETSSEANTTIRWEGRTRQS
jgi:hypothetical protein